MHKVQQKEGFIGISKIVEFGMVFLKYCTNNKKKKVKNKQYKY